MHISMHVQKINFLLQALRYYIKSTSLLRAAGTKKIDISLRSALQNTRHIDAFLSRDVYDRNRRNRKAIGGNDRDGIAISRSRERRNRIAGHRITTRIHNTRRTTRLGAAASSSAVWKPHLPVFLPTPYT